MSAAGSGLNALYRQIHDDIESRIVSGEWPPGYRIPSEHELTLAWGCSRMTINKALSQLAQEGYIERRRRAGSFVRQPRAQTAILEIHDIATEVASLGLTYRFELLERSEHPADRVERAHLGIDARPPVLSVRCLHYAGTHPFCLEERLINLEVAPQAATADFALVAPSTWLLANVGWNLAEHAIAATPASSDVAAALAVPEGTACLAIERRTWLQDDVVTWVRLTYDGDRHSLVARFSPNNP